MSNFFEPLSKKYRALSNRTTIRRSTVGAHKDAGPDGGGAPTADGPPDIPGSSESSMSSEMSERRRAAEEGLQEGLGYYVGGSSYTTSYDVGASFLQQLKLNIGVVFFCNTYEEIPYTRCGSYVIVTH